MPVTFRKSNTIKDGGRSGSAGALDHQFGRFINHDLAGYHVPVHADMPEIEVLFVE